MDRPLTEEQLKILLQLIDQAQFKGTMAEVVAELKAAVKAELETVMKDE
ncbi:MAG: hypothetical protein KKB38_20715 [Gammaproteobacteria bacterium]|nr:hypothetical protein [Gammaproteobacteria bacterium]